MTLDLKPIQKILAEREDLQDKYLNQVSEKAFCVLEKDIENIDDQLIEEASKPCDMSGVLGDKKKKNILQIRREVVQRSMMNCKYYL